LRGEVTGVAFPHPTGSADMLGELKNTPLRRITITLPIKVQQPGLSGNAYSESQPLPGSHSISPKTKACYCRPFPSLLTSSSQNARNQLFRAALIPELKAIKQASPLPPPPEPPRFPCEGGAFPPELADDLPYLMKWLALHR
jgi:hypothetical protein